MVYTPSGLAQGYSIRTKKYRLNRWKYNGSFEFELYDLKQDPHELNNIAHNQSYLRVLDSLKLVMTSRVLSAQKYPSELGKQIDNVQPWDEPKQNLLRRKKRAYSPMKS